MSAPPPRLCFPSFPSFCLQLSRHTKVQKVCRSRTLAVNLNNFGCGSHEPLRLWPEWHSLIYRWADGIRVSLFVVIADTINNCGEWKPSQITGNSCFQSSIADPHCWATAPKQLTAHPYMTSRTLSEKRSGDDMVSNIEVYQIPFNLKIVTHANVKMEKFWLDRQWLWSDSVSFMLTFVVGFHRSIPI